MRRLFSFLVGLISFALGLLPLLNQFGVVSFSLPYTPTGMILAVLMIIGALILFVDSSELSEEFVERGAMISGIIIILLGGAYLISNFYTPLASIMQSIFGIQLLINILLLIAGFFMLLGSFYTI